MDLRKLKTLIELVESSGITELEVTEGEEKVRIAKAPPASAVQHGYMIAPQQAVMPAPAAAASAPAAPVAPTEPAGTPIKSPMVGTFYRSGAPGAKPFVEVGSQVKEGDVLCIIEAMKLMNEIVAEQAGVVVQALVENGQPVEYGQTLFIIE